jgi:hypothetical protein
MIRIVTKTYNMRPKSGQTPGDRWTGRGLRLAAKWAYRYDPLAVS